MPVNPRFTGKSLEGVDDGFIQKVLSAAKAVGISQIHVNSGYRSKEHNAAVGGVPNSNHVLGHAIDADAFIPGRGWVPLGTALLPIAQHYGLRSGDVEGFYHGGKDPVHVDDATNLGGVKPMEPHNAPQTTAPTQTTPAQPASGEPPKPAMVEPLVPSEPTSTQPAVIPSPGSSLVPAVQPSVLYPTTLFNDGPDYSGDSRRIEDIWRDVASFDGASDDSKRFYSLIRANA